MGANLTGSLQTFEAVIGAWVTVTATPMFGSADGFNHVAGNLSPDRTAENITLQPLFFPPQP